MSASYIFADIIWTYHEFSRTPSPLGGEGWGEGVSDSRYALAPSPDAPQRVEDARKRAYGASASPPKGEVKKGVTAVSLNI